MEGRTDGGILVQGLHRTKRRQVRLVYFIDTLFTSGEVGVIRSVIIPCHNGARMNIPSLSAVGVVMRSVMLRRVLLAVVFGLLGSGIYLARLSFYIPIERTDMLWGVDAARDLLVGRAVYGHVAGTFVPYPLTAAMVGFPFVWLTDEVATPLLAGLSMAMLAFALTRDGQWWRLAALSSPPALLAAFFVQWSPLFLAAISIPALAPLVVVKPTLAFPVALTARWSRRTLAVAAAIVGLSLIIDPLWPIQWLSETRGYAGFVPLMTIPGIVLLLAALRWRDPRARFLLLLAITPQHVYLYDQLLLWHLPQSKGELFVLNIFSWLGFVAAVGILATRGLTAVGPVIVLFMYLPALALVLRPHKFVMRPIVSVASAD